MGHGFQALNSLGYHGGYESILVRCICWKTNIKKQKGHGYQDDFERGG